MGMGWSSVELSLVWGVVEAGLVLDAQEGSTVPPSMSAVLRESARSAVDSAHPASGLVFSALDGSKY